MVVTAHQTNLLPGLSVMRKVAAADTVIWCDGLEFTRYGWINRNRLADDTPLLIPVDHRDLEQPINRVRIASRPARWRRKLAGTLRNRLGTSGEPYAAEIERPYRLLIGLNVALLRLLCHDLEIRTEWIFMSHLDAGTSVPIIADNPEDLIPISRRLALMTAEVGGDTFLAGPSARNYLDETPFRKHDIRVHYWHHEGPNPSAISLLQHRHAVTFP